jgi:TolB protein
MTSIRLWLLFAAAAVGVATPGTDVGAQPPPGITITLNPNRDPMKRVAVMPMAGPLGDSVRAIVRRDLDYSDAVTPDTLAGNDRTPYLEANRSLNYTMFAGLSIQFVVDLTTTATGMHAALYDIGAKQVAWQKSYDFTATPLGRDWRMRVHVISDDIVEQITGARGIAATRIAMTCPVRPGVGNVCLIDTDGHNNVWVPVADNALSAAWHPSGDTLVYGTYGGPSKLIAVALGTGGFRVLLGAVPNTQYITPRYSRDGSTLYYSRSDPGGANLYRLSLASGGSPLRLTGTGTGINAQVSVNHNNSLLTFASDRAGHNDVYTMNADGTDARLILNWSDKLSEKPERIEPDFSPDGRLVALSAQRNGIGNYQITVVTLADQKAQIYTDQAVNEQPSWAPDNRHIVFTSNRSGVRELWIVDIVTGRTRQLTHNNGSKLASWSPRLVPR